ncbi:6-pyruvoyl trahydropterin synthase family protein [Kineococcus rhizosphaerae]|uniref:6-carboxy-5,6,7,8-tetrahydropterin synthase n=1 Tax=Kineococcus rhizosphaerae TaxID=559628 RepID=A0A2T0RAZ0_9ACTN|nr:6-carboxytetrahydropterin synthase [Kineococcus rhizosphaerae]PRY18323.1 6-pyruvoyl-tetrahydropterin synthase [Kineococcus rhizosphaerae]
MYSLTVRDRVMVAHSFTGEVFGPAQRLHGATFVVEATFRRSALDADGLVVDIGVASRVLREVLAQLDYRNLDDVPELAGRNTTTEFLCGWIAGRLAEALPATGLEQISVLLRESDVAWAAYDVTL